MTRISQTRILKSSMMGRKVITLNADGSLIFFDDMDIGDGNLIILEPEEVRVLRNLLKSKRKRSTNASA